ncbi:MAG TPA: DUF1801 domain-containing protein [Rectinemataceae bacterium]|nr:DUF1801 domain-containing protein [Rectinemataceae bacterium]
MESGGAAHKDIDEYIQSFPPEVRKLLEDMRAVIRAAAPDAVEKMSYQMPAFTLNGILVHFAAFKHHIGFFPTSRGIEAFRQEAAPYISGKGTMRFPIDKPLPLDLVSRIVKFRVGENMDKSSKPKKQSTQ